MIVVGVSQGRRNHGMRRDLDVVAEIVQTVCNYRGGPVTVTHAVDVIAEALGRDRKWVLRRLALLAEDGRVVKLSGGKYSSVAPALAVWS